MIIWPVAAIYGTPTLLFNDVVSPHPSAPVKLCRIVFPGGHVIGNALFKITESIFFFFIPVLLQLCLYASIGRRLLVRTKNLIARQTVQRSVRFVGTSSGNDDVVGNGRIIQDPPENHHRFTRVNIPEEHSGLFAAKNSADVRRSETTSNERHSRVQQYQDRDDLPVLLGTFRKVRPLPPLSRSTTQVTQMRKGVIKMLVASVAVYVISYAPSQITTFYNMTSQIPLPYNWTFTVTVMILTYINSAANPLLYAIFSQNFRRQFVRLLCRGRPRSTVDGNVGVTDDRGATTNPPCSRVRCRQLTVEMSVPTVTLDVNINNSPSSSEFICTV